MHVEDQGGCLKIPGPVESKRLTIFFVLVLTQRAGNGRVWRREVRASNDWERIENGDGMDMDERGESWAGFLRYYEYDQAKE